jgi:hypothetical protein
MMDEGRGRRCFYAVIAKKTTFWGVTNRLIPKKSKILVENLGQVWYIKGIWSFAPLEMLAVSAMVRLTSRTYS